MPTAAELICFDEPSPDENPWVVAPPLGERVDIIDYQRGWPDRYAWFALAVRRALGDKVLGLEHVGSTAVAGLAAKDVIDIDLTVIDPGDEAQYVPVLETVGWQLTVREPSWYEHRCLRFAAPRANLHVFGPDCPEAIRHVMFRDWLRSQPEDRERYELAKRAAALGGGTVVDYNARKQAVIRDVYQRAFLAAGLL